MPYKLEDILKKEELKMKMSQNSGDNSTQIQVGEIKKPKKEKRKKIKIKEFDKKETKKRTASFEVLIKRILLSFISLVGIISVSCLLIKFIFILFS